MPSRFRVTSTNLGFLFIQTARTHTSYMQDWQLSVEREILEDGRLKWIISDPRALIFLDEFGRMLQPSGTQKIPHRFPRAFSTCTRVAVTERYHQTPYPVWDLSLSRPTGRLHPYLQLTNLSNTGCHEIAGAPMPPRALTGGIEIVLSKKETH
jgi:hypothetical protein